MCVTVFFNVVGKIFIRMTEHGHAEVKGDLFTGFVRAKASIAYTKQLPVSDGLCLLH